MDQAVLYPLDYQRSLERTLRIRLDVSRKAGRVDEVHKFQESIARLRRPEYGTCVVCSGVIPFLHVAEDPSRQTCVDCSERER
jgi:RNA polymerase-binding transcription factor DksA